MCTVRLRGGLTEQVRFIHLVDPAIRRKCTVDGIAVKTGADLRVVAIEPLGLDMPMFDITTGTGDFIANGVISHNCFARGTHEWLELDSGHGLRHARSWSRPTWSRCCERELARPTWRREHVALGTNTDPYQRAEGRYRLMPGVIGALAGSGTPFSDPHQGHARPPRRRRCWPRPPETCRSGSGVSVAIWDDALHTALEPGVPSPRARLDLVRAVTGAGLPCGVFLAPVLPWLTDDEASLDAAIGGDRRGGRHRGDRAGAAPAARCAGVVPRLAGPRAPGAGAALPRSSTAAAPTCRPPTAEALARRVAPILAAHGLDRQAGGEARGVPGDTAGAFPAGSLPASAGESEQRGEPPGAADPAVSAGQPASRAAACWARTARTTPRAATGGRPTGQRQPPEGVVGELLVGDGQLLGPRAATGRGGGAQVHRRCGRRAW